jgi:cytochrome b6-f complex iron-sulfur subunit
MAEKISELSGEARDQRIAELKAKMQAAAKKAQAEHQAGESPAQAAAPAAAPRSPAAAPAAAPKAEAATVATAEAAPVTRSAREAAPADGNGAAAPAAPAAAPRPKPAAAPKPEAEVAVPALSAKEMGRREFLVYAWGAALGLLALQGGLASFLFMYPRFREGEFGGVFPIGPESALPDPTMAPVGNSAGKFWLVTTEAGEARALYMVCTHLGCLYKWEGSNNRFECPCHGSKFSHDGYYIEGPAPRSLDTFEITIENGEVLVDTGARITGSPSAESPARAAV